MVLNFTGGPTNDNLVDAPIILSEDYKEMYKNPQFYAMAHFSKFILPGSIRIDAKISGSMNSKLLTTAFLRPDNKVTVVIYNGAQQAFGLTVEDKIKGRVNIRLKPKSINTLLYDRYGSKICIKSKKKQC